MAIETSPAAGADTSVDVLCEVTRVRARAEFGEWSAMLAFADAELARIETSDASAMVRLIERSAIALEIGQAVGLSEGQVQNRLACARRVRTHAPSTWLAFRAGRIDAARVREISSTLDLLERHESRERLDETVVAYAASHTLAELRAWLRRFVVRVEADLAKARAERARRDRSVQVVHVEDSMSWVNAYLPTHQAAAIDERLRQTSQPAGPDDDRTRDQRRADAFTTALLAPTADHAPTSTVRVRSDVAVVIDAEVLVGKTPGFATASDGSWVVPAEWVLEHLNAEDTVFHRLLVDPITRDMLAHEYVGRFAPAQLAAAVAFRDGVCQAPGCMRAARDCDLDHREPWPGPTTGSNLWPLCRRHHRLKGQRTITWVLPSGRTVDAEPVSHTTDSHLTETRLRAAEPERRLLHALIEYVPRGG